MVDQQCASILFQAQSHRRKVHRQPYLFDLEFQSNHARQLVSTQSLLQADFQFDLNCFLKLFSGLKTPTGFLFHALTHWEIFALITPSRSLVLFSFLGDCIDWFNYFVIELGHWFSWRLALWIGPVWVENLESCSKFTAYLMKRPRRLTVLLGLKTGFS